ncbi:hypothetical protein PC111_g11099 [Phytophthora cactorum]|uniref:Uncharacterized protein n=1 Tax=Phytophthora cactorum TaxID=29920 RepID=A0A8T1C6X0_9STRA|nr:hypothetical protein PC111_g11099 [Phytophthora cactorum]KAG2876224.1 hypothetical protein PC114_g24310 [Phytophthora cactorum]KAG2913756.1 hypothetical protein PC115_g11886 [Phytophthora cactorum]KAG2987473.1 hypothetical protein PC120_g23611 [Phytophthora cactorum]KAG3044156.1 hypothetical protein PC121_g22088 [Phytophthora cactorum]
MGIKIRLLQSVRKLKDQQEELENLRSRVDEGIYAIVVLVNRIVLRGRYHCETMAMAATNMDQYIAHERGSSQAGREN